MRPCRPFPLVLLSLLVALALVWPARCESEVGQHQALGLNEDAIGGPWARAPRREQHLQRWRLAREEKARMQRLGLLGDLLEVRQGCSCSQLTAQSSSQCSIHALRQYSSVGCDDVPGAVLTCAARYGMDTHRSTWPRLQCTQHRHCSKPSCEASQEVQQAAQHPSHALQQPQTPQTSCPACPSRYEHPRRQGLASAF